MLLSTVCLSTVCAVGCQSALVIRPSGSEFTKAVGTSMLLTCEDSAATPGSRLVWKDNRNRDVTVHSQQGYVSQSPLYMPAAAAGDFKGNFRSAQGRGSGGKKSPSGVQGRSPRS